MREPFKYRLERVIGIIFGLYRVSDPDYRRRISIEFGRPLGRTDLSIVVFGRGFYASSRKHAMGVE